MSNVNDLITVARGQLGVCENPLDSNSGPQVNAFLKSANSEPGSAWCMAFVYWCHLHAGITDLPQTASVDGFYKSSLALGKLINFSEIAVGDIILRVNHPALPNGITPGNHAGIYTGTDINNVPLYISGNTVSTNALIKDRSNSYVDEHAMKNFNFVARFWQ